MHNFLFLPTDMNVDSVTVIVMFYFSTKIYEGLNIPDPLIISDPTVRSLDKVRSDRIMR